MRTKRLLPISAGIIVFLFSISNLSATIRTVSNNPSVAAQYSTLQAAFDAASVGDTIYVHGSLVTYADAYMKKKLVVIGPGYIPSNPTTPPATVNYLYLDSVSGTSGVSGSYIMGMTVNSYLQFTSIYNSRVVTNITYKRNKINNLYLGSSSTVIKNFVVEENRIGGLYSNINTSLSSSILIRNNVIGTFYNVYKSIVVNNIIHYNTDFTECSVSNNIFMVSTANNSSSNSTFNNNLYLNPITYTSGTNTLVGAITADPQFEYGNGGFNYVNNYHLKAGSAALNAGTDGKDLGIYGGSGHTDGGVPPLPQIYFYNLKPNYVQVNGNIQVTIQVKNQ